MSPDKTVLLEVAAALDVALSNLQIEQLLLYRERLVKWNRVYNLSSVRDPEEILSRHIVDSLSLVPDLQVHPELKRLLDVGSGGGLPGVVVAIACPAISVTCIDAVAKKAAFVQSLVGVLGLKNLTAVHSRVESYGATAFDCITSRAFSSLAEWVKLSNHLSHSKTLWVAMKGAVPTEEITQLPATHEAFHVKPVVLPGVQAQRCLVWIHRHD